MLIERGECRSLISWLMGQEQVLRLWIDEVATGNALDLELVRKLEEHRLWLTDCIDELTERAA